MDGKLVRRRRKEQVMQMLGGDMIGRRRGVDGAVSWGDDVDEH